MSTNAIAMPRLGMTMEEGTIVAWPLEVGSPVKRGEIVLIIETEKAESEIEATSDGVIRHVYVDVGETVPCGALLAAMTDAPDDPFDAEAFSNDYQPPEGSAEETEAPDRPAPASAASLSKEAAQGERKSVAPAARALAKKLGIDPTTLDGTGPKGRVTKADVEAAATARQNLTPINSSLGLEVLREGQGEPLALLPGFGTDVSAFALQSPSLAEHFEVIGINPRGVGQSDASPDGRASVAQTATDVAAVLDTKAHIVGASLGAAVALELALAHPEKVRSLTLLTPFLEVTPRLEAFTRVWIRARQEASVEGAAEILAPWLFGDAILGDPAARSRMLRGLAQTIGRTPAETLERQAQGLIEWSGTRVRDLSGLSVPTLIVAGGEDLLTPDAHRVVEAFPQAHLETLEGCGHALSTDGGPRVTEIVLKHLTAQSEGGLSA